MGKVLDNTRVRIEQAVGTIWCGVLNKDTANPDDDFFKLGGNSLTAVKFLAELENRFGVEALTPDQLYDKPTFAEVVSAIESNVRA